MFVPRANDLHGYYFTQGRIYDFLEGGRIFKKMSKILTTFF